MQTPRWLDGIGAQVIAPHIWEVRITGYGAADVGPYAEAVKYAARLAAERQARAAGRRVRNALPAYADDSPLEAHHIVGREHLAYTKGPYDGEEAPAVVISAAMHRKLISPRITAEQNALGGRPRGARVLASAPEVLELYRQVYTWHTPFVEMFYIARNMIA